MLLTVGTTEAVEAIAEAQENLQEVAKNPGILRTYFQNLVPDLLNFALQVVIAVILYAVGAKLIVQHLICCFLQYFLWQNGWSCGKIVNSAHNHYSSCFFFKSSPVKAELIASPGATIGHTLSSLFMIQSITTGVSDASAFFRALLNSSRFVAR